MLGPHQLIRVWRSTADSLEACEPHGRYTEGFVTALRRCAAHLEEAITDTNQSTTNQEGTTP